MPRHACSHPGCPATTPRGVAYCDKHEPMHRRLADERRPETRRIYNSSRWQRVRAAKFKANPVCEECDTALATSVHHKQPVDECPDLAFDPDNLMSVCEPCHTKLDRERRRREGGGLETFRADRSTSNDQLKKTVREKWDLISPDGRKSKQRA